MDTTVTPPTSSTPFNGGAPLTPDMIAKMRIQAGINTNPATAVTQLSPQNQIAALKSGTFAQQTPVDTNQPSFVGGLIRGGLRTVVRAGMNVTEGAQAIGNSFSAEGRAENDANDANGAPIAPQTPFVKYLEEGTDKPLQRYGAKFDPAQGLSKDNVEAIAEAAKAGIDVATFFAGGGEGASILEEGLEGATRQALKQGAKTGAAVGAVQAVPGAVGEFSDNSHSFGGKVIRAVGDEAGGTALGAGLGAAVGVLPGALKSAGISVKENGVVGAAKKGFRDAFTKAPAVQTEVASNVAAEHAPGVIEKIKQLQEQGQAVQKNPRALSPTKSESDALFGKGDDSVATAINNGRKAAGEKMGTALSTKGVGDAPVDIKPAVDTHTPLLDKALKTSTLSRADQSTALNFRDALYEFKKPQPLAKVDSFLRDWQGVKTQDPTLNKALTNMVHDINETAKSAADDAENALKSPKKLTEEQASGTESHPYRESNDEYAQYKNANDFINEQRGELNPTTKTYEGAHKILHDIINPSSSNSVKYDAIDKLVGESTKQHGLTMTDRSAMASFIHDIYTGVDPKTALSKASISISPVMSTVRTGLRVAGAEAMSPDTIVAHMIDLIEKNAK